MRKVYQNNNFEEHEEIDTDLLTYLMMMIILWYSVMKIMIL